MPLTPADVHNVAFKKPPIGKRGYDEEEVDAFLDEVERELARLLEENAALRSRSGGGGRVDDGGADPDLRLRSEVENTKMQLERARRDKAAAEHAARSVQAELEQARAQGTHSEGADGDGQLVRVLMMAQRTADDHVNDARREAEQLLAEARGKAEQISNEAQAKADAVERDARQRHQDAIRGLDDKRSALLKYLDELTVFERDYRARLKEHLMSVLQDTGAGTSTTGRPGGANGDRLSLDAAAR
jgi:DivIVA domain-containing protein